MDDGLPRVRLRLVALGRRRHHPQSLLRRGPGVLLAADDQPGAAAAAPAVRTRLLGLRDRVARERRAAGSRGRARARRRPAATCRAREGDERHAPRHRLRPSALRPLPRRDPRHLGAADGQDPALGSDQPRHLRCRRLRLPHGRSRLRKCRAGTGSRRHGQPGGAADDGPPGPRRAAGSRSRRSLPLSSSASAGSCNSSPSGR